MAARKRKPVRRKRKSAGTKRKAKPLSASVQKTLRAKAKKTKWTYGQLARVYRRGQGAYLSSGSRPGVSMSQWAFGRVNSFIRGGHSQDNDIKRKSRAKKKKSTKR